MRTLMLMMMIPSLTESNRRLIDETFSLATGEATESEQGRAIMLNRLDDSLNTVTNPASSFPDIAAWAADFWIDLDTSALPPLAQKFVAAVKWQMAEHLKVCKGHDLNADEIKLVAPMINNLRKTWANMLEQIAKVTPADADAFIATLAAAKIMGVSE